MTFTEIQKFPLWAIWLMRGIILIVLIVFGLVFLTIDLNNITIIILLVSLVVSIVPLTVLEFSRLKTTIDKHFIRMNFVPFSKKVFAWSDVHSAELIDYGFVGGWGIRMGTQYGTVYNTQGREGLWLKFKDGKKIVIGTQRKEELQRLLDKHFHVDDK